MKNRKKNRQKWIYRKTEKDPEYLGNESYYVSTRILHLTIWLFYTVYEAIKKEKNILS